jgi:hypothetical protein
MAPTTRLTQKRLLAAAREQHGNMAGMARSLGASRQAIYDAVARYEPVKLALFQERETMIDVAEAHLYEWVLAGEPWALRYVLGSGPGRRRGWGDGVDAELAEKIAVLETALRLLEGKPPDDIDYRAS